MLKDSDKGLDQGVGEGHVCSLSTGTLGQEARDTVVQPKSGGDEQD